MRLATCIGDQAKVKGFIDNQADVNAKDEDGNNKESSNSRQSSILPGVSRLSSGTLIRCDNPPYMSHRMRSRLRGAHTWKP